VSWLVLLRVYRRFGRFSVSPASTPLSLLIVLHIDDGGREWGIDPPVTTHHWSSGPVPTLMNAWVIHSREAKPLEDTPLSMCFQSLEASSLDSTIYSNSLDRYYLLPVQIEHIDGGCVLTSHLHWRSLCFFLDLSILTNKIINNGICWLIRSSRYPTNLRPHQRTLRRNSSTQLTATLQSSSATLLRALKRSPGTRKERPVSRSCKKSTTTATTTGSDGITNQWSPNIKDRQTSRNSLENERYSPHGSDMSGDTLVIRGVVNSRSGN